MSTARTIKATRESTCSHCQTTIPVGTSMRIDPAKPSGKKVACMNCARQDMQEERELLNEFILKDLRSYARKQGAKGSWIAHCSKAELITFLMDGVLPSKKAAPAPTMPTAYPQNVNVKLDTSQLSASLVKGIVEGLAPLLAPKVEPAASTPTGYVPHKQHDEVLESIVAGNHLCLWGEAGSGKTHTCLAIAEQLGREVETMKVSRMASDSALLGYMNASGEYVSTPFVEMARNGGLLIAEELDDWSAAAVTALNTALANDLLPLPSGTEKVHEDFIFIATTNTPMLGPDPRYPTRQKQDGAFRNRLDMINFIYDEPLEEWVSLTIAGFDAPVPVRDSGINIDHSKKSVTYEEVQSFTRTVRKIRRIVEEQRIDLLVSPRASYQGTRLLSVGCTVERALEKALFKGCNEDVKARILANL